MYDNGIDAAGRGVDEHPGERRARSKVDSARGPALITIFFDDLPTVVHKMLPKLCLERLHGQQPEGRTLRNLSGVLRGKTVLPFSVASRRSTPDRFALN